MSNMYSLIGSLLIVASIQLNAQTGKDSVLLTAMRDELNRNMNELQKKDHDKPFFISYTIADIHTATVSAKMGALTNASENRHKDWNVRVMVGNYGLNDENFVSDIMDNQNNKLVHQLPLENDYKGVRMALWTVTNNVYNSAATLYKQKKQLIKDNKVKEELLEIADFSESPTVKMQLATTNENIDPETIKAKAKQLSSIFNNYPDIYNSEVTIHQVTANAYFINSEETEIVYPLSLSTITVTLGMVTDEDEFIFNQLIYNDLSVSNYPENKQIFEDIEYMVNDLKHSSEYEIYDGYYSGPVLFYNDAASEVLESALFGNGNKLVANRKPLKRNDQYMPEYDFESQKRKEWKIGKKVIDPNITLIDYSSLTTYNEAELWGNYKVDAEGVVPADSLVLIEEGVLKNKYNDRTPAPDASKSTGHKRYSLGERNVQQTMAPGVLKLLVKNALSEEDLKNKLLKKAKEDGYEYAVIVKNAPVSASDAPKEFFKVDIETGEETRLRKVSYDEINHREFRNTGGFSDEYRVKNSIFGYGGFNMQYTGGGVPVSYIMPSAVLIDRVDIISDEMRIPIVAPIVSPPIE